MCVSRLVNFAAAIVISGIQWTAFLSPASHTQAVQEVGTSVANDASDGPLPVIVVTAYRRS
jgi:hypothetical protein